MAALGVGVLLSMGVPGSSAQDEVSGGESASEQTDGDEAVSGDIPVLGTFTYQKNSNSANVPITGVVHGVRRVEGATAVYYSVATRSDAERGVHVINGFAGQPSSVYKLGQAAQVKIIDPVELKAYTPLQVDGEGGLVSDAMRMEAGPGDLVVLYALLPELPASTTVVNLQFEEGAGVTGVPVQDGPMLPEVQAETVPLGQGWPALPGADLIAKADPGVSTYELLVRSNDIEQVSEVAETAEDVSVTLAADFFFDSGQWALSKKGVGKVEEIASEIAERGVSAVTVTGYTDSVPDNNIGNDELSKRRAQTVAELLEEGAPGVKVKAVGRGEADPVASNSTDEGKAQNRRVTVHYEVNE